MFTKQELLQHRSSVDQLKKQSSLSPQNAEIRHMITDQLHRGVTVYRAAGGYQSAHDENRKVLFCVVTRLEVTKLLTEIDKIDPHAFVVQHSIREIKGGVLKKHVISH